MNLMIKNAILLKIFLMHMEDMNVIKKLKNGVINVSHIIVILDIILIIIKINVLKMYVLKEMMMVKIIVYLLISLFLE